MQFCGLTILTDKKFSKEIAAATKTQRQIDCRLVARLVRSAERYRVMYQELAGRRVK